MGRDLTLYPEKASKLELKQYLEPLGFFRCEHLWDWPKGTLNYSWFENEDFKSIDGVSADIYPVTRDELNITGNDWALHVRNLYSASWHDVKMLNTVLRGARKLFGGTIKGDYGTNRYAPLWKDESTPISRGVSLVYSRVLQDINSIKYALPDSSTGWPSAKSTDKKMNDFFETIKSLDPVRVLYNGLVPFAVSMFEYFYSHVFKVLISYDPFSLAKRNSSNFRVDFSTLLEVNSGIKTVEDVIAEKFTFQNIEQVNKAYLEWLDIDIKNLFLRKKRVRSKMISLEQRLQEIIQFRHGIVHKYSVDQTLTKEGYIDILETIVLSINEFVRFLEKKYSIKIERVF